MSPGKRKPTLPNSSQGEGSENQIKAVVWSGVSSKSQATEDRESLDGQLRDGVELCERKGWQVVARLVVPGITRSHIDLQDAIAAVDEALASDQSGLFARQLDELDADAPNAYRRLAELIEARRVDVVVCRGRDRIGRTDSLVSGIEERLRRIGASVYSLAMPSTGTVEGDLYVSAVERASVQHYVVKLVHATRRGMDKRAGQGMVLGGPIPFGYRVEWRQDVRGLTRYAAVDEREAEAYRWAVASVLDGSLTQVEVAARLRERFTDRRWSHSSLRDIFRSAFYIGLVVRRRARSEGDQSLLRIVDSGRQGPLADPLWPEVEGLLLRRVRDGRWLHRDAQGNLRLHVVGVGVHEPLIDVATWLELQRLLERRAETRRPPSVRGLWGGILHCGRCGRRMHVSVMRRNGHEYVSYRCGSRVLGEKCGSSDVSERKVTRQIVRYLEVMLEARSGRLDETGQAGVAQVDRAAVLRREIVELRERHGRILLLFETGRISLDEFDARRVDVNEQLARREDELGRLVSDVRSSQRRESRLGILREVMPGMERRLLEAPVEEANRLLRQIFTAIYVENGEVKGVDLE